MKFSPTIGFMGKYQFTDGFAFKSGLEYQQKGRSYEENGSDRSNRLQYLNLPMKGEFSAGENAGFNKGQRIYFAVGPYLSYLLDAEGTIENIDIDLNKDTKNFDFGLGFEIGFEFPVLKDNALQLGLNYDMGLIEVYQTDDYKNLHNKLASISLGVLF